MSQQLADNSEVNCRVIISQILHRVGYLLRQQQQALADYNKEEDTCNSEMEKTIKELNLSGINFFSTTEFNPIDMNLLDGVHFIQDGNPKLTRYIRGDFLFRHNLLNRTVSHSQSRFKHRPSRRSGKTHKQQN